MLSDNRTSIPIASHSFHLPQIYTSGLSWQQKKKGGGGELSWNKRRLLVTEKMIDILRLSNSYITT
jgi:hypothetical protein